MTIEPIRPSALAIDYDPWSDIVCIEGIRYHGNMFRHMGLETPPGRWMRIIKREDGVVALEVKLS